MKTSKVAELLDTRKNNAKRYPTTVEDFEDSARRYLKAVKDGRVVCSVGNVSSSGMSRTLRFVEVAKNKYTGDYQVLNFHILFEALGFTSVKGSDYYRISGCGMDMIFYTNYTIVNQLHNLGFITKKTRKVLEQKTPTVI